MSFLNHLRPVLMDAADGAGADAGGPSSASLESAIFDTITTPSEFESSSDTAKTTDALAGTDTEGESDDEVQVEETADDTEAAEPAADEEPEAAAPADPAATEPEWDPEVGAPKLVTKDGKEFWQYPKARGERLYAGYKLAKEYQEVAPTLDEAKHYKTQTAQYAAFTSDFRSGEPTQVNEVLGYLNRLNPQAMAVASDLMIQGLPKANPEAYSVLRSGILTNAANEFYSDYAKLNPESEEAQRMLFAAQSLDYLTGKPFRDPDEVRKAAVADPLTEREAKIKEQEDRLQRTSSEAEMTAQKTWSDGTNNSIRTELAKEFDLRLEPLKELRKANPEAYKRAFEELKAKVAEGMESDQQWNQMFKITYKEAQRVRNDEVRAQLRDRYLARARTVANRAVGPVVKWYADAFKAELASKTSRLKAAESRKSLTGSTSGTKPLGVPTAYKKDGMSVDDQVAALMGLK